MGIDAGSVYSQIRVDLATLKTDLQSTSNLFDAFVLQNAASTDKLTNSMVRKWDAAMQAVNGDLERTSQLVKAGAITEQEAVQRQIAMRQQLLAVLTNHATVRGEYTNEEIAQYKQINGEITKLQEGLAKTGSEGAGAFAGIQSQIVGTITHIATIAGIIETVKKGVEALGEAEGEYRNLLSQYRQLEAVLKSTGASAWTTMDHLKELGETIEESTGQEKDLTASLQTVLLGFREIRGVNFDRAVNSITNMAKVMKMDVIAATQAVGKALDKPIEGMDALSRQGFRWTEQQKEMIKAWVNTGETAKAQAFILDELDKTFGDAAAASYGLMGKIKTANKDIQEETGRAVANNGFLTLLREGWLKIAEATAKALKLSNDYKEAAKAEEKGNATQNQRIVIIQKEIEDYQQLINMTIANGSALSAAGKKDIEHYRANIKALQDYIEAIKKQIKLEDEKKQIDAKAAEEAEKAAKAAAEARTREIAEENALAEYLIEKQGEIEGARYLAAYNAWKKKQELKDKEKTEEEYLAEYIIEKAGNIEGARYLAAYNEWKKEEELREKKKRDEEELKNKTISSIDEMINKLNDQADEFENTGRVSRNTLKYQVEDLIANAEKLGISKDKVDQLRAAWEVLQGDLIKKDAHEEWVKNFESSANSIRSIIQSISEIFSASIQNQLDALERQYNKEQELLEYNGKTKEQYLQDQYDAAVKSGNKEKIADAKKELEKYKLEEEYEKKRAQLQYKIDLAKWEASTAEIVLSEAVGIAKAWEDPLTAPLTMALVIAADVAQLAAAMIAKPQPPQFQTGGIVLGSSYSGDNVIARVNSGEMILTQEQQAKLFRMAQGSGAESGNIEIPISLTLDGKEVAHAVARRFNNGEVRLK